MSDSLARARESALEWLSGYDPGDGHGLVAQQALDPGSMFTQPVVVDAYVAGANQASDEWAVERATGQRQLDDATALMTEAAQLLRGYEAHHRKRATEGSCNTSAMSLAKAERNALMAARLEAWLAGEDHYPVAVPRDTTGMTNIKPVTSGPMADVGVIDTLVEVLGGPAHSVSMAKVAGFHLQTADPRFDPKLPVLINGYRFTPATESR